MSFVVRSGPVSTDPINGVTSGLVWRTHPPSPFFFTSASAPADAEAQSAALAPNESVHDDTAAATTTKAADASSATGSSDVEESGNVAGLSDGESASSATIATAFSALSTTFASSSSSTSSSVTVNGTVRCDSLSMSAIGDYATTLECLVGYRAHAVHDDVSGLPNLYCFSSSELGVRCLLMTDASVSPYLVLSSSAFGVAVGPSANDYPIQYVRSALDPRAVFTVTVVGAPTASGSTIRITHLSSPSLRVWATGVDRATLALVPEPTPPVGDGYGDFFFESSVLGTEEVIPVSGSVIPPPVAGSALFFIRMTNPTNYATINTSGALKLSTVSISNALTDANQFMFTLASAPTAATRLYNIQCMRTGFKKYISFVKSGTVTAMVMVTAPDANSQFSLEMDTAVLGNFRIYHPITDRFLIVNNLTSNFQPGGVAGAVTSSFSLYSKRLVDGDP